LVDIGHCIAYYKYILWSIDPKTSNLPKKKPYNIITMATLVAPSNHSPKEDADVLWKAVKG
jgi:hypothetical protein